MSSSTGDLTLNLAGLIYEASLDPDKWQLVLEQLAVRTFSDSASLRLIEVDQPRVHFSVAYGLDEHYDKLYQSHYVSLDPFRPLLEPLDLGVHIGDQLLARKELEKTEFYNDFLKPQDRVSLAGGLIARNQNRAIQVALHRREKAGPFEPEHLVQIRRFIPHLVRAADMNQRFSELSEIRSATEHSLDQMSVGLILVDEAGTATYSNSAAEEILASGAVVDIRNGQLIANRSEATERLQQLIKQSIQTSLDRGEHPGGGLPIVAGGGDQTYYVVVSPLKSSQIESALSLARVCAAVFIGSAEQKSELSADVLNYLFGLTRAEARLAVELARGFEIKEIAERLNISPHTARTQLKAVFQKTGTRRQTELVKLLLISPARMFESQ
jgi:DNA-binding CsgD family transcriptional regulator/PAS domain-containing protein